MDGTKICVMPPKFLHLFIILFTIHGSLFAHDNQPDYLISQVDEAVNRSDEYIAQKEKRITLLRMQLRQIRDADGEYQTAFRLYEEYKPFINDSAIFYLNRCIALATASGNRERVGLCRSLLALRCSNTGMYNEALTILGQVNPDEMGKKSLGTYYFAYVHVYGELAYYTHLAGMRRHYEAEQARYRRLMFGVLPRYDNNRMQVEELTLMNEGRYKQSMAVNNEWLKRVPEGSHVYALVALYRYLEYKNVGDSVRMMQWLARSVLADIRNGVLDQGSMWEMANQLMVHGDVDRAYRYISFTSDCAGRFGSRQRLSQISPLLSTIANQYKAESEKNYHRLMIALGILTVFMLLVLILYYYTNRQRQHLAEVRDSLKQSNCQLSELNQQLLHLNEQLVESNAQLTDANRVKEEYVGRFMRMCSVYVDRLDGMRKRVSRLVKTKRYDELNELVKTDSSKEQELDELYVNFDKAFLHLFPNFVDCFNELLRPDEQVQLSTAERLNTTVRIFALIRLGIDDSSKIAEFLHYSVNTIYNYRARVKNGAKVDRDTFEERVKAIGTRAFQS